MRLTLADRLSAYGDELDRQADALLSDDPPPAARRRPAGPQHLPGAPMPTRTHDQVASLLVRILELGSGINGASDAGPRHVAMGTALRVMRRLEPEARESLATVPEDELRRWLSNLAGEIGASVGMEHTCPACGASFADGPRPPLPA